MGGCGIFFYTEARVFMGNTFVRDSNLQFYKLQGRRRCVKIKSIENIKNEESRRRMVTTTNSL